MHLVSNGETVDFMAKSSELFRIIICNSYPFTMLWLLGGRQERHLYCKKMLLQQTPKVLMEVLGGHGLTWSNLQKKRLVKRKPRVTVQLQDYSKLSTLQPTDTVCRPSACDWFRSSKASEDWSADKYHLWNSAVYWYVETSVHSFSTGFMQLYMNDSIYQFCELWSTTWWWWGQRWWWQLRSCAS